MIGYSIMILFYKFSLQIYLYNIDQVPVLRGTCMQDSWLRKKAEEIQSFADRKDMKHFHAALKTVYGPKSSGATPLLSADGSTLLTDKDAILKRCVEHFDSVLNRLSTINDNAINRFPQVACNVLLDKESNSPGSDAIPAEIYKAGGQPMAEKLTELFHCMWRKEARPQEFKDASIIHIYKRKETAQVCHNHRDNSVMACLHRSRPIESTLNGYSMAENTMLNSVGTCTVQHDVFRHAYRCFSGL